MESTPTIGRPLKFGTPEELQKKIDEYFSSIPWEEWTITGLALHLGSSREVLMDYQGYPAFSDTVKTAKLKVQYAYERDLRRKGRSGDIFALKNFGWKDKQEVDVTSGGQPITRFNLVPPVEATVVEPLKLEDGSDDQAHDQAV